MPTSMDVHHSAHIIVTIHYMACILLFLFRALFSVVVIVVTDARDPLYVGDLAYGLPLASVIEIPFKKKTTIKENVFFLN